MDPAELARASATHWLWAVQMAIEQALAGPRTLSITPDQEAEPEPLSEADLSPSPSPSPSQFLSPGR